VPAQVGAKLTHLPGGRQAVVTVAFIIVGAEVFALEYWTESLGQCLFHAAQADALQIQAQAGQFAFYFRYAGGDGKSALSIPTDRRRESELFRTRSGQ